ncbi:MAG: ImmA/IrrE family metallo-endopeptidase [Bacillota bacterium]|nr:ImmA/IrrE family metallo-endopeptidase [Bacillota bacterium]MDW7678067.1 ImmA/IrrE family metallo-endopeptidase [Bacillota bacterium]
MRLNDSFVPVIRKAEYDAVATKFLRKYCPEALRTPMSVPIDAIASDHMGLDVQIVRITEDLNEFGKIFFTDGVTEVYVAETDEYIFVPVTKGTVFIDENVFFERNVGCARNTLAHECFHWFAHRPYHELQIFLGNNMAVASRCHTKTIYKQKMTETDWMERQANAIAPRILMPKEMFMQVANECDYLRPIKCLWGAEQELSLEFAARELGEFFNVSTQSAMIRLKELGYCQEIR